MPKRRDDHGSSKPPVTMSPEKAIGLLKSAITEIEGLRAIGRKDPKSSPSLEKIASILRMIFGEPSVEFTRFDRINFSPPFLSTSDSESDYDDFYLHGLNNAKSVLD